jgi:hypothetical protein
MMSEVDRNELLDNPPYNVQIFECLRCGNSHVDVPGWNLVNDQSDIWVICPETQSPVGVKVVPTPTRTDDDAIMSELEEMKAELERGEKG